MAKYSLSRLRAEAIARMHEGEGDDYSEMLSRIFSAKFSWAFDYSCERDYLLGAVILRREVSSIQDSDRNNVVSSLNDSVLKQLATKPFASAMEIEHEGRLYVLANIQYLCFTRSEDGTLGTTVHTFMARMLMAEAIGMPLSQDVLNRLHEIVIFPKELLEF